MVPKKIKTRLTINYHDLPRLFQSEMFWKTHAFWKTFYLQMHTRACIQCMPWYLCMHTRASFQAYHRVKHSSSDFHIVCPPTLYSHYYYWDTRPATFYTHCRYQNSNNIKTTFCPVRLSQVFAIFLAAIAHQFFPMSCQFAPKFQCWEMSGMMISQKILAITRAGRRDCR